MRYFYQLLAFYKPSNQYGVFDLGLVKEEDLREVVDRVMTDHPQLLEAESVRVVRVIYTCKSDGKLQLFPY